MKIKLPAKFNKMSIQEQEDILVKNLNIVYFLEKEIKQALAKVRGGTKFEVKEVERPDEALLKA
ncbi:hypothetical protein UFOVP213_26 [uncultured Caudovirales phage]|uniref:Uncharacterized protein n=1 Tax=uncultured Caudovirales phage TaxID=2100421 RepID=A0A6J7WNU8_9CAUD|nr:hypothetical protein UFOVP213_26 [uncultured Caudovirales phage]